MTTMSQTLTSIDKKCRSLSDIVRNVSTDFLSLVKLNIQMFLHNDSEIYFKIHPREFAWKTSNSFHKYSRSKLPVRRMLFFFHLLVQLLAAILCYRLLLRSISLQMEVWVAQALRVAYLLLR